MALGHIKRGNTARVCHQVLDLTRAPHGVKTPHFPMLRLGAAAPQRVIKAIDFGNFVVGQRFIICAGLAQSFEQFFQPSRQG
jgi:hypothetical protein